MWHSARYCYIVAASDSAGSYDIGTVVHKPVASVSRSKAGDT